MMPLHDPDGLRRLDRELAESAELARRLDEARANGNGTRPEPSPEAEIVELPELVDADCGDCEVQEQRPA